MVPGVVPRPSGQAATAEALPARMVTAATRTRASSGVGFKVGVFTAAVAIVVCLAWPNSQPGAVPAVEPRATSPISLRSWPATSAATAGTHPVSESTAAVSVCRHNNRP